MRLIAFAFSAFSPLAIIGALAAVFPAPYAICMQMARATQQLTIEQHLASGRWQQDDKHCAAHT
jgi:hypothetical protein